MTSATNLAVAAAVRAGRIVPRPPARHDRSVPRSGSLIVLAIGLGVLYRRRTQPIAIALFGVYAVIALIIAAVREPLWRSELTRNKKILIGAGRRRWCSAASPSPTSRSSGPRASPSTPRTIQKRNLEAIVSASGKIQPKRFVNISADTERPGHRSRGQRRRPRQEGPVPAADRPAQPAHARSRAARPRSAPRGRRPSSCGCRSRARRTALKHGRGQLSAASSSSGRAA